MKKLEDMTAVEVANYEFSFLNCSEKAVEVRKVSILECEIVCESGKVLKAMGLLAQELCKALNRYENN